MPIFLVLFCSPGIVEPVPLLALDLLPGLEPEALTQGIAPAENSEASLMQFSVPVGAQKNVQPNIQLLLLVIKLVVSFMRKPLLVILYPAPQSLGSVLPDRFPLLPQQCHPASQQWISMHDVHHP